MQVLIELFISLLEKQVTYSHLSHVEMRSVNMCLKREGILRCGGMTRRGRGP